MPFKFEYNYNFDNILVKKSKVVFQPIWQPKSKRMHTHASWDCRARASKTNTEEKTLLNKVIIFVVFVHKKVFS